MSFYHNGEFKIWIGRNTRRRKMTTTVASDARGTGAWVICTYYVCIRESGKLVSVMSRCSREAVDSLD